MYIFRFELVVLDQTFAKKVICSYELFALKIRLLNKFVELQAQSSSPLLDEVLNLFIWIYEIPQWTFFSCFIELLSWDQFYTVIGLQ